MQKRHSCYANKVSRCFPRLHDDKNTWDQTIRKREWSCSSHVNKSLIVRRTVFPFRYDSAKVHCFNRCDTIFNAFHWYLVILIQYKGFRKLVNQSLVDHSSVIWSSDFSLVFPRKQKLFFKSAWPIMLNLIICPEWGILNSWSP